MRITDLKKEIAKSLETELPSLEASMLLEHFLEKDRVYILTRPDEDVPCEIEAKIRDALEKRNSHIPMAYITKKREFYGLTFFVNEHVLIPQPDTETLVQEALKETEEGFRVLDICTGSGAVAIAIKMNSRASVCLSDIDENALLVAKKNYRDIVKEEPDARLSDLFASWQGEEFDIITANPPYVTLCWYSSVSEEVKHEPKLALIDYAPDGLDITRRIIREAKGHLRKNGSLLLESDWRQCEEIRRILALEGYVDIESVKDLAGKERVTKAKYPK